MDEERQTCPQCGKPVDQKLLGLCPECMLKAGFASQVTVEPSAHNRFEPPAAEDLAKHFPQLEILSLIGRGGMGAVYKARQKQLGRTVALKILPPDVANDGAFADRFAREARALAAMGHPNIVTLYEFGEANGLYFFLMEYVDGVNLRQLMAAGKLAPKEALAIVPQVCDALQYAHDRGIVHRDIKPENILIGRDGVVKIADFGVARIVGSSDGPAERGVMGTPAYMAPEQVERPAEADHRADIYSLGVVLYQMLTGELPGQRIEPPSRRVQIDVRIDEIVLRALEKSPEMRFSQASEFKTQVETVAAPLEDRLHAKTPQAPAPAGRSRSWRTLLFGLATACALANMIFSLTKDSPVLAVLWAFAALGFAARTIWLLMHRPHAAPGTPEPAKVRDGQTHGRRAASGVTWRATSLRALLTLLVHLCLAGVIATVLVYMLPPIEHNLQRSGARPHELSRQAMNAAMFVGRNEELNWALLAADAVVCLLLARKQSRGPLLVWGTAVSLALLGATIALLVGLSAAVLRAGPVPPSVTLGLTPGVAPPAPVDARERKAAPRTPDGKAEVMPLGPAGSTQPSSIIAADEPGSEGQTSEYYVSGKVARPGMYAMTALKITLKQALVSAGLEPATRDSGRIRLVRRDQSTGQWLMKEIEIPVRDLLEGRAPDRYLQPGDVVIVGDSPAAAPAASMENRGAAAQQPASQPPKVFRSAAEILAGLPAEALPDTTTGWDEFSKPKANKWLDDTISDRNCGVMLDAVVRSVGVKRISPEGRLNETLRWDVEFLFESTPAAIGGRTILLRLDSHTQIDPNADTIRLGHNGSGITVSGDEAFARWAKSLQVGARVIVRGTITKASVWEETPPEIRILLRDPGVELSQKGASR